MHPKIHTRHNFLLYKKYLYPVLEFVVWLVDFWQHYQIFSSASQPDELLAKKSRHKGGEGRRKREKEEKEEKEPETVGERQSASIFPLVCGAFMTFPLRRLACIACI